MTNEQLNQLKGEPFTLPNFNLSREAIYVQLYYRFTLPYLDGEWNKRILTDLYLWEDAIKHGDLINYDNLKVYLQALIKDKHTRPYFDINCKGRYGMKEWEETKERWAKSRVKRV